MNVMHPDVEALLKRTRIRQHTSEWYRARGCRLTASDVPAVLGHNKYCSRATVLRRKTCTTSASGQFSNAACAHGHKYEALAARAYSQVTGIECVSEDIGLVCHPQHDCFAASPDRVAVDHPILVEIKCPYRREIEVGRIPEHYIDQVEFQMAVTGLSVVHFVQFKPATLCARGAIDITEKSSDPTWWQTHFASLQAFVDELRQCKTRRTVELCADGSLCDVVVAANPDPACVASPPPQDVDLERYDVTYQKIVESCSK